MFVMSTTLPFALGLHVMLETLFLMALGWCVVCLEPPFLICNDIHMTYLFGKVAILNS